MKRVLIVSILLVAMLVVPVHAAPKADQAIDYTPRLGKTATYEGVLVDVYTEDGQTVNDTMILTFNVTFLAYSEHEDEANRSVRIDGIASFYENGTFVGTMPISDVEDGSNSYLFGVLLDDLALFLAYNVSHVPEALYRYTFFLSPRNFTAELCGEPGSETLTINVYLGPIGDFEYAELHVTYLLRYGLMLEEHFIAIGQDGEIVEVDYYLVDHEEIDPIPEALDVPAERNGLHAKREITNGTETGYASIDVEDVVVVGEVVLFYTEISVQMPSSFGYTRTSTFGRLPTKEEPRALPPAIAYPEYVEEEAAEYNATIDYFVVGGENYTVYVFGDEYEELGIIADLGVVAFYVDYEDNISVTLVELEYPEAEQPPAEESSGGTSGRSMSYTVVILAIVVLVLALLALLLSRKGARIRKI